MKQEKEYSEHRISEHQERRDRDRPRAELVLDRRPTGSTTEEEPQVHLHHRFENTNDKEVWWNVDREENSIKIFDQLIYLTEREWHRGDHRREAEKILLQIGPL